MIFTDADERKLNRACDFSSGHKLLLLTLGTYRDSQGRAWPSRQTLIADTGLQARRLRGILRDLVDAGFLVITDENGLTVYTLQKLPEACGNTVPEERQHSAADAATQCRPSGNAVPLALIREEPRRTKEERDSAGAGVETFSDEGAEGRADLVAYRGSEQPLARLAWAERTAKFHVEALGLSEGDAAKLRGEWQAFLVGRAERARANQANMLQVDQAAARLREIVKGGGVAYAVEAVGFAIASGAVWPVPKPSRNGVSGAKVSSFGGDLMRSYEGTAKTTATAADLKGFGL